MVLIDVSGLCWLVIWKANTFRQSLPLLLARPMMVIGVIYMCL